MPPLLHRGQRSLMFKAHVFRRGFSLWNRSPTSRIIRSAAQDGHETIQIQRVRFKRRFFSRSRLLGTAIVTLTTYSLLQWLDEDDEEEQGEAHDTPRLRREANGGGTASDGQEVNDEESEEEEEEEDEDEDNAIIFLPTGFSRARPRTFYKGSDPEWREFVRLAPDKQRTNRIRMELVTMVRGMIAKSEHYQRRLGKIKQDKGNVWVEIKFPDGPPIEYERPGIELTEDLTVRWTTRPVDQLHHSRLSNALYPSAVANSLYADTRQKAGRAWQDFRSYIGWEDKTQKKQEALARILTPPSLPPNFQSGAPSSANTPASSPTGATPAENAAQQQAASTDPTSSTPPQKDPLTSTPSGNGFERFLPSLPPPTNMTLDLSTFRASFKKEHQGLQMQPPRGTFIVTGLVEVIGDRARMTLDVAGAYDPRIGKYVMIRAGLRSITDYRQHPKGGP